MAALKGSGLDATDDQPAKTQTNYKTDFTARRGPVMNALLAGDGIQREFIERSSGASTGVQVMPYGSSGMLIKDQTIKHPFIGICTQSSQLSSVVTTKYAEQVLALTGVLSYAG